MAACLALAFTGAAGAAQTPERLHLVHADVFRRSGRGDLVVQELVGNVKLVQGKTTIVCDRAVQKPHARIYELVGNVRITDTKRTLLADKVFVYEKEQKQIASGHVVSTTARDTTRADRMTYFRDSNRVLSEGSVSMVDIKRHTVVAGNVADYYRDTDFGVVSDSARLVQYDSLWTEQTRILADTLKLVNGGKTTVAVNNVAIYKKETTATCGRATYFRDAGKIVLDRTPVIEQGNQRVEGDSLQIFLKDAKMTQAVMRGHASAVSDAAASAPGRWQNKLAGQEIRFYFEDEKITKAVVTSQATSLYHIIDGDTYKGANELSGDVITVQFNEGSADQVIVRSNPDVAAGSYLPSK